TWDILKLLQASVALPK
ncbi:unnamed protein product, partial [Allacma fusca]